ncbi:hypothetical protein BDAP_000518 [Binucleata daphniae]
MKTSERKLLSTFYTYVKFKNYAKIPALIKSLDKLLCSSSFSNDYEMKLKVQEYEKNKEVLKIIIRNEIKFYLVNNGHVKHECLEVVLHLDDNYQKEIQFIFVNDIINKTTDELRKFMENDFKSLRRIGKLFEWHKNKLENLRLVYSHVPDSWNIIGDFNYYFCVTVRRSICFFLFNKTTKDEDLSICFKEILRFEKKYTRYDFSNDCCTKNPVTRKIEFNKNLVLINDNERIIDSLNNPCTEKQEIVIKKNELKRKENFCEHKKMLSQVLIPFLEFYIQEEFKTKKITESNEEETLIIKHFIHFFSFLGEVYVNSLYFNDDSVFDHIVKMSDLELKEMIKNIGKSKMLRRSCVVINTLYYIDNTNKGFLERIRSISEKNYKNLTFMAELRQIETAEYKNIEALFRNYTSKSILNKPGSKFAINALYFLEKNIFEQGLLELNSDLINVLLEMFLSTIFSGILVIKLSTTTAEHMLKEIVELKRMIKLKIPQIPFIDVVERYLKIFLVDSKATERFIINFENFSQGTFQFSQILKMLSDDSNHINLFIEYKKYLRNSHLPNHKMLL